MIATRAVRLGVCLMLAVAYTSTAFAWGPQAHRVIARVAEERLSPAAKAAIGELLIPPDTLPDVAGWADKEGHDAVPGSAREAATALGYSPTARLVRVDFPLALPPSSDTIFPRGTSRPRSK